MSNTRLDALTPEQRRLLARRLRERREDAEPGTDTAGTGGEYPLSLGQERLWMLYRLQPESAAYNMSVAQRVTGPYAPADFERALDEIVRRQGALRTRFEEREGHVLQVVEPHRPFRLRVEDLSAMAEAERERALGELAAGEAAAPIALEQGPPFRARLVKLGADDHVLLFTLHHIVGDGLSFAVLWHELGALLTTSPGGDPPPLPRLTLQYGEFARAQRERLSGSTLEARAAWWRKELEGVPARLELPADLARPHVRSDAGAVARLELPAGLHDRVWRFAAESGATPFMVVFAACHALLARYAGTDDLVVGTAIGGRDATDVERLIGFFANTLAVRGDLSGNPSFRSLVERIRSATLRAFDHAEIPFDRVVEAAAPERGPGWPPLVQAVFLAELAPPGTAAAPTGGPHVEMNSGGAKFDLTILVEQAGGRTVARAEYATDLFRPATVQRMLHQYALLLAGALDAPDEPLAWLALLDAGERDALAAWSAGAPTADVERSVHALFLEDAARHPERVAVAWDGGELTYGELALRSAMLAERLAAAGVRPGDRVGLLQEGNAARIVAMVAVLRVGAAYVPLDPDDPADRLAFVLADAGIRRVVADPELSERLAGRAEVLPYEGEADPERSGGAAHVVDFGPEALAYVMYTSGSTGTPKGVAVPHRGVVRLVRGERSAGAGEAERWLHLAPPTFDASTLEIWAPLLNGGRLVLAPPGALSAAELRNAVTGHGITSLWLTAGLFHLVAAEEPGAFRGLRRLLAGGDVLSASAVARVVESRPAPRLVNGYGPTENTTFTTCHEVDAGDLRRPSIPIGRPVAGTTVHVLDPAMRPVPALVPGEICTGGAGVAWGYLARPGLTAERFVPDPYGAHGSRLYRTGDRARWTADGTLEFLGRIDRQVKVRGFRIEPGEVEAALRADPAVGDAVVTARGEGLSRQLVAYATAAPGAAPDADRLRESLRQRLPRHMVPAAVVLLERIPLTANGKVDRRALPDPVFVADSAAASLPATPTEDVLAGIWSEVLGLSYVGRDDDFFALGGHSLLATQVASRVRHVLATELPLRAFFEAPTLAALAARVDDAVRAEAGTVAPPLLRGEENDLPLSFAQERLWFIDRLEPGSPVYNMPFAVRIRGDLDVAALERSLAELVRRHESLRTRFPLVNGRPVQRIEPFAGWSLAQVELHVAEEGRNDAVLREKEAWSALPFDLAEGPVFRARLVRIAPADHLLLIALHHVAGDGWSMGVFWRELVSTYRAAVRGEDAELPLPAVRYADFAAWQRGWLAGDTLRLQADWWREHLAGAPPLLEFPTDRPRPATQSHRGAAHPFLVPPELADELRAFARREGSTLFMVLLAAWQLLLARWSGQDDVVVGTPVAGRTRRETEGVIGFFVNTLAIRGDLGGDPSFRALLARVREATLGAYAHQDLPFERLVEELHPERSLAHGPVYQAMLVLQNVPEGPIEPLPGVDVAGEEPGTAVAKVDVTAGFASAPEGGLAGAIEYARDLWDAATMERVAAQLVTLLGEVLAAPHAAISTLPLLSPQARAAAAAAGTPAAAYDVRGTLHERFAAQAARTPLAVAVTARSERITYRELEARAGRIAARLRALGAAPERIVGIALERTAEIPAAILGVLKTGAAYLPLDPSYPAERLAYMVQDAGAKVVVTTRALAERLPEGAYAILRLDEIDPDEPGLTRGEEAPAEAGSLAYVIYTSGSTGRPKGVQVTHGNVLRLFAATDPWFGFSANDAWTLFHSYAFDFCVWEIWGALLHGGRLVVVPFETSRTPTEFLRLLAEERVTVLNQTPSAFRQLARADADAAAAGDAVPLALRLVIFGGEALDPGALADWVERRGTDAPRLVNMYGITETTVHVTYRPLRAEDVGGRAASPVGVPIPDLALHLLDSRGQPVDVGMRGEIHVGGAGLARGYLGRPALTAERFVPDPFGSHPGARLYRSGDLARRLPDGGLDFGGRADDQVKVRGFRIEPGEIEAALLDHPSLREAVVRPRGSGDAARLVAWTVAEPPATGAELRRHLRERLPEHMVPASFVALDALPLTRNGKVDLRALPEPDDEGAGEAEHRAPRTQTEQLLAMAWSDLLRRPRVGVDDRFFDLGGHSLLATRLVSRVRELFGVELPVRAVFERSALGELAGTVDALLAGGGGAAGPIVPAPRGTDIPLSFAQERLWFVQRMEGDSSAYHMPFAYRLAGALDAGALERAVAELLRRHESLRTVFARVDGAPVQRMLPDVPGLAHHDLSDLAAEERDAEATRISRTHAEGPFDLERGPLFRAALVRLSADEHRLHLNMHHIVSDGWSTGVLFDELSALYASFAEGQPSPLAPPVLQYADYAAWQRGWLEGDALEGQLAYWRRRLAGAPPLLSLPSDRPRPASQRHRGAAVSAVLDGEDAAALHALARSEGATLFMVLLSALDVVLARWSGQEDVVVGTPVAGRTRAEAERMIGLFLNSLALRVDVGGSPTFAGLLRRVREATLEAFAHQDVPFERVLEEVRPERSLSHTPVFQVMLNLANFGGGGLRLPGLEVEEVGSGGELASKFDLTLYAGETADGGLYLHLVYDADLFDAPRMGEMLAQITSVLRSGAADPARPVEAMSLRAGGGAPLPDPAEVLRMEAWGGGVSERVVEHALGTPAALALEGAGERWSYAEVDSAADVVAARLADAGVRPGDVVAVWAHRSPRLVIALLGTWRAGSAFVVLDPAYPPARLARVVRAAAPAALLRIGAAGEIPAEVMAAAGESGAAVLEVGEATGPASGAARAALPTDPDAAAYVAFTSGTTGAPRGIVGTHRPLSHFFRWHARELGTSAEDRVAVLGGLAHDPLLRDLFAPLWVGAAVVFPDPDEVGSPGYLADWARDSGVTVAHLTPATGELLADTAEGTVCGALRVACFGGDRLRTSQVRAFRAVAPQARVVNFYGATETPQAVAFHDAGEGDDGGTVPVGKGIDGVQLLVLTPSGEPAGVGELGEIVVRTPYLARGYLGDPAATAERFVPAPWSGDPADRLYRTGDLGRHRPDGAVELAGRADRQVKVRGFRIEPAETEAALRTHPAVRGAWVDARGEGDARRLVAWVAADRADAAALRAHARSLLPEHAVPAAYVPLDALPLTPNGKIDTAALPDPDAPAEREHVPPRTETERALADIWGELLPLAGPGADDDFFALGGHSLLATRLAARIHAACGAELPLRAIFQNPVLADLAAEVDRVRLAGAAPDAPPLVARKRTDMAPASVQQERMWFVDRLQGGGPVYHMPSAHHFAGTLAVGALRQALDELVRRHEALRTVLPEGEGGIPMQRILPPRPVPLPLYDLSALAEAERAAAFTRRAAEHAAVPFDLESGPLFHAALVRLSAREHVLLLDLHHAVSDGWTNRLLLRELSACYEAFRRGEPSPLASPPLQYADYAIWQRGWLEAGGHAREAEYWRDALAGAPPLLALPADRPRPAVPSHRGGSATLKLSAADLANVRELARRESATLFMALLAGFATVLGRWADSDDVVVGTPVAGRTRPELEGVAGLFLNSLALRARLDGDPSFREVLRRARAVTLNGFAHQELPFERVLEVVRPPRSTGHTPVFQVMLNLLAFGGEEGDAGPGDERFTGMGAVAQLPAKFDLTLYAAESEGGLAMHLVFAADLFDAPRMGTLLEQVAGVLRTGAAAPDRLARMLVGDVPPGLASVGVGGDAPPPPDSTSRRGAPSDTERAVAAAWGEVLGIDAGAIAPDADFFALGGHSLRATQVLARIRRSLGVRLPIRTFFANPTIAGLAGAIADAGASPRAGAAGPSAAGDERPYPPGTYPLSFAQRRLWVLMQLGAGAEYHMASALRLHGELDEWALERALEEIVRRHDPLRTRIEAWEGEPVQVVTAPAPMRLRPEQAEAGEGESPEALSARLAADEATRPFPFGGPYARARLLRIAPDDHLLLWTTHHLVSDGWSVGIFHAELAALYEAFSGGEPSPLPPLPTSYGEHALAERRALSDAATAGLVEWWRAHLSGAPELLALPADRPRPPVPSGRGGTLAVSLPSGTAERVAHLARAHGATPFMVLLAAWSTLLGRWSGQGEVVVGTPVANRNAPELEPLIGFFAGTLPLRTRLGRASTFAALVERVRDAVLAAFDHAELPFERLVEELNPPRTLSHAPVFQTLFAYQNVPGGRRRSMGGVEISPVGAGRSAAKFDLALTVAEQEGATVGTVEYAADLFDAPTIERLTAGLGALLDAALADPATPRHRLPVMNEAERAAVHALATGPGASYGETTLHALFTAQAGRTPGAVAVLDGDASVTYGALDGWSAAIADRLRRAGACPERPVAVVMERSAGLVAALLGVLRSGAPYVPVDPDYPPERVAYMLEDCGARLAVAHSRFLPLLPHGLEAIVVDEGSAPEGAGSALSDPPAAESGSLAYVIYTSGSTGSPKGAMNEHRGVVNRIRWMQDAFGLRANDAVLQKTPISFDVSVWEFFWPLSAGATLVMAPPGAHREPREITALAERAGVTTLHFVPSMLRAWLQDGEPERCSELRRVMCSGEALPPELALRFHQALPGVELHNLYGPTEAAVDVTHWRSEPDAGGRMPIGRPIANTACHVLDAHGARVPRGVAGELFLGGVQVGRGYWRRPALTAERFLPDPFAAAPGARMYRTGDRARWGADGALEYLGRTDLQVKVRGFRVEPGEVEAALTALPGVRAAVVDVRDGRLVAWVARDGSAAADPREALLRVLPEHLVPSVIVPVERVPLTPSGKADRRALPDPGAPPPAEYVVPRDVAELEVARIWAEVLGVPRVGAADDFFRLGGHSLLALRMLGKVRARFGRDVPLAALFRHPTVAGFAAELRKEGANTGPDGPVVTLRDGTGTPLFLLPPAGGTVTHYAELARLLGTPGAVHALQAPGVTAGEAPLTSVDALAERFVADLRRVRPHGPYRLGGWSAGGVVAFAAAALLEGAGERVDRLVLLDAPAPDGREGSGPPPDRVSLLRGFAQNTVTGDPRLLVELEDALRAAPPERGIEVLAAWTSRHGAEVGDDELARVGRVVDVFAATAAAVRAYRPRGAFRGRTLLVVAAEGRADEGFGPDALPARWRPLLAGELEVRVVPGEHARLVLEPAVAEVAAALGDALATAAG